MEPKFTLDDLRKEIGVVLAEQAEGAFTIQEIAGETWSRQTVYRRVSKALKAMQVTRHTVKRRQSQGYEIPTPAYRTTDPPHTMEHLHRVLDLPRIIDHPEAYTSGEMAAAWDVSQKTVRDRLNRAITNGLVVRIHVRRGNAVYPGYISSRYIGDDGLPIQELLPGNMSRVEPVVSLAGSEEQQASYHGVPIGLQALPELDWDVEL